jgi:flavin reductase (DIM6/NTAB) family NADH-FMN oxidoreductase RutF
MFTPFQIPPLIRFAATAFTIRIRHFAFPALSMVSSKTSKMLTPPLTASEFRKALGHFTTGVTVVTVEFEPGKIHGMTANSFTSVSLDPMLILVCVDRRAKMLSLLEKKKSFGISILKAGQEAISEYFAKGESSAEAQERLSIRYRWTPKGIPVLEDTLLQLSCNVVASHASGDHTIFVGEVADAELDAGEPLLYFRGEYRRIARHS